LSSNALNLNNYITTQLITAVKIKEKKKRRFLGNGFKPATDLPINFPPLACRQSLMMSLSRKIRERLISWWVVQFYGRQFYKSLVH